MKRGMRDLDFSDADLYWMAGLFEGEASFMAPSSTYGNKASPRFAISMVDEDIISRVADLLGASYCVRKPAQEGWQPQFYVNVQARWVAELMRLLLPLMGERRSRQISAALSAFDEMYPNNCEICGSDIPRPNNGSKSFRKYCDDPECRRMQARRVQANYRMNLTDEQRENRRQKSRQWLEANPEKRQQYLARRRAKAQETRDRQPDFYDSPCAECGEKIPRPKDRRTNSTKKFCSEDCMKTCRRRKSRESSVRT